MNMQGFDEIIITNRNDIYVAMETISQLEPESILDIGMLLKRAGCISRTVLDYSISDDIILNGIDIYDGIVFNVWNNVYNEIINYQNFTEHISTNTYYLCIALGIQQILEHLESTELLSFLEILKGKVRYLLTNNVAGLENIILDNNMNAHYIKSEEDTYYLIELGE